MSHCYFLSAWTMNDEGAILHNYSAPVPQPMTISSFYGGQKAPKRKRVDVDDSVTDVSSSASASSPSAFSTHNAKRLKFKSPPIHHHCHHTPVHFHASGPHSRHPTPSQPESGPSTWTEIPRLHARDLLHTPHSHSIHGVHPSTPARHVHHHDIVSNAGGTTTAVNGDASVTTADRSSDDSNGHDAIVALLSRAFELERSGRA